MTYAQATDYLFTRLPMFTRIGSAAYKDDLTNILALSEFLGNPHKKFRSIHVAGTNGKGSVSHMLAAILQSCGYKTALFTSPHLYDFRERIRINGEMIHEQAVVDFVRRIQPQIDELTPSFFEITVAMAFDHFAKEKADIAVIEVGLGGRLDSTNIIQPELSIITNIGWDHMNILGNSLASIAKEKAGIIKNKVPVIVGERPGGLENIFIQVAESKDSPVFFAEDEYMVKDMEWTNDQFCMDILHVHEQRVLGFCLDLPGIYQAKNLCTVLTALDQLMLQGYHLPAHDVHHALARVRALTGFSGRWQVIGKDPLVILDVAHNESGVKQLLEHLPHIEYDGLHIILGMVKDKDAGSLLSLFPQNANYYFTHAHIPRALPAQELQELAAERDLRGEAYENVSDALVAAKQNASSSDVILICGSIFLVAEVQTS